MDITVTMVRHHVWLLGELIDRAERLDDDTLDQIIGMTVPGIDDDPSIRSLLTVMVGQLEVWLAVVEGKESPEIPPTSIQELRERHTEAGRQFAELVDRVVREDRAAESFREGTADHPDVFTYGGMVAHVLTFAAHRRTLAISALQSAGNTDLRHGDPMLFFAER